MDGGNGGRLGGPRRRGREIALQVLFQWEAAGNPLEAGLEWAAGEYDPGEEVLAFAAELCRGVTRRRLDIDGLIARYARDWDLERLARVDRNVLRLGIYELLYAGRPDVPPPVAINEAVELAKRYSSEDAARFVNGILGQLARDRGLATGSGGVAPAAAPETTGRTPVAPAASPEAPAEERTAAVPAGQAPPAATGPASSAGAAEPNGATPPPVTLQPKAPAGVQEAAGRGPGRESRR
ncbi:NusB antitermination factor [Thermaerobacter marianensis DSM 12885]|uniref:Transcription antitermination protein NusB n=1 Tax=Thermaerobacter marianensis (strain ATCC 700841 / DSM 12885 / JCM 10246 / 7p75a) TaxID=644966 RepID=E6SKS8_THEM7|nr:transcription antitermination factor NusB [Thermaerobacter marianensis]ADU51286.1 NusB antitermination factor [Thermaerobacter marianensis DSM 12885]